MESEWKHTSLRDAGGTLIDRVLRAFAEDLEKITGTFQKWKRRAAEHADLPGFCKSATLAEISTLSLTVQKSLEIPLPPLPEQNAIAAVLGALDDKIDLNRRMNATLEAMVRALFQSWFVDFEPVRAKAEGCPPPASTNPPAPSSPPNSKPPNSAKSRRDGASERSAL